MSNQGNSSATDIYKWTHCSMHSTYDSKCRYKLNITYNAFVCNLVALYMHYYAFLLFVHRCINTLLGWKRNYEYCDKQCLKQNNKSVLKTFQNVYRAHHTGTDFLLVILINRSWFFLRPVICLTFFMNIYF